VSACAEKPASNEAADENGIVWVVGPTFSYEWIGYCPAHEAFLTTVPTLIQRQAKRQVNIAAMAA